MALSPAQARKALHLFNAIDMIDCVHEEIVDSEVLCPRRQDGDRRQSSRTRHQDLCNSQEILTLLRYSGWSISPRAFEAKVA